jgi:sigma-E factor negative regulatory protein RseA
METTMSEQESDDQLISALADGELRGEEFSRALALLGRSEQAMALWQSYHIVGDVLRGESVRPSERDARFLANLKGRLDAPAAHAMRLEQPAAMPAILAAPAAANDTVRPWRRAAIAASIVALATVGWHVLSLERPSAGSPQLAQGQGGLANDVDAPAVMLRDPRLDELMAAHRQFGGTSALQMPSGFLRNATFGSDSSQGGR